MEEQKLEHLEALAHEMIGVFFKMLKEMETFTPNDFAKLKITPEDQLIVTDYLQIAPEERGIFIRQKRKLKGWSQNKLAQETGIGFGTLRRYESGERFIDNPKFLRILKVLDDLEKE